MKRFRGLEGPARVFVVLACCGAAADLVSLVTDLRRHVHGAVPPVPVDVAQVGFPLAAVVSYLVWFHRAYTNLRRLGVPEPFVPVRLHDDLWRASDPELPWPAARGWATAAVPVTHLLWWPAAIAGAVAGVVPGGAAAGDLLRIAAAGLAISIVLAVTSRQRARAYRAPWAR